MRRNDREITDIGWMREVLAAGEFGVLALCRDGVPYAVPLNYGYTPEGAPGGTLWFHGAPEGRKMEWLRANPRASFSVVAGAGLLAAPEKLHWSFRYRSVIASGEVREEKDRDAKIVALHVILRHYGEERHCDFPEALLGRTAILALAVTEITGKRNSGWQ